MSHTVIHNYFKNVANWLLNTEAIQKISKVNSLCKIKTKNPPYIWII